MADRNRCGADIAKVRAASGSVLKCGFGGPTPGCAGNSHSRMQGSSDCLHLKNPVLSGTSASEGRGQEASGSPAVSAIWPPVLFTAETSKAPLALSRARGRFIRSIV